MLLNLSEISLMQGRLTKPINKPIQEFPKDNWKNEINELSKIGLSNIEWVVDLSSYELNPIIRNIYKLEEYLLKKKVNISAVSNDYFLDLSNSVNSISFKKLYNILLKQEELIYKLGENKKYIMVLPLIENASLKEFKVNEIEIFFDTLLSFSSNNKLDFALELDIDYKLVLKKLGNYLNENIFINLDIGNTVSYGFDIKEEIYELSQFIINVHLKDRKLNGPTVPLGEGDTQVENIIKLLKSHNYYGMYTLQFARKYSNDIKTIKEYIETIIKYEK